MIEHIKVPQDRIGALIGPEGKIKEQFEKKAGVKLEIDSESGEVVLEGGDDAFKSLKASEAVKAIGRGFSPDKAIKLIENEDLMLDVIDLSKISDTPADITRLKGRVIGRGGKTREIIETMTGAKLSVYGKTICVIGDPEQVVAVRTAIDMLIDGAPHGAVYGFLEKRRREMKKSQLDSILLHDKKQSEE